MLNAIPPRRRPRSFPLAAGVPHDLIPARFPITDRTNLVLPLAAPGAKDPTAGYGKTLRKKLRRHPGDRLTPATPDDVIATYRAEVGKRIGLRKSHYATVRRLMTVSAPGFTPNLFSLVNEAGEVLATGFFPTYRGRTINLFGASTPAGYRADGMARLLHAVIEHRRAAGDHNFDFEGSNLPGVAAFFRSFGPREEPYIALG